LSEVDRGLVDVLGPLIQVLAEELLGEEVDRRLLEALAPRGSVDDLGAVDPVTPDGLLSPGFINF
jgi:hypothetical protein